MSTYNINVSKEHLKKWQELVDTLAELMNIENALVTKGQQNKIKIINVYNKNKIHFKRGQNLSFKGKYCEKVISNNKKLIINNVNKLKNNNFKIKKDLISYMGYPIKWPNGDIFGTLCVFDNKERNFKKKFKDLMKHYKELIESDLKIIYQNNILKKEINEKIEVKSKYEINNKRLKAIYNNIKQGICLHEIIYDGDKAVDYKIIDVNNAYTNILNINAEKAINSLASDIYESDTPPFFDKYIKVAETGKPTEFEAYFPPLKKYFNITVTSPKKGQFITIFSDVTEQKERIKKIENQKELLIDKNMELTSYNEEIIAMNEELEQSLIEFDKLNKRFTKMIDLVTNVNEKSLNNEYEFFSDLLKRAIDIVPEADYGKICIVNEKGKCSFIDAIGHKLNILKDIDLNVHELHNYKGKGVFKSNDYFINIDKLPNEKSEKLHKALKPIKDSLYINITVEEELVGRIALDIKKESNKEFTNTTKNILKSFSTIASSFFAFKKFYNLKKISQKN